MELVDWDTKYTDGVASIKDVVGDISGIFVAYNANIDAIKHLKTGDVERMLERVDINEVKHLIDKFPRKVKVPAHFLARLIIAMREGDAAEVPTYTTNIHTWLSDNIGYNEAHMGGQAGIIANLLARIGTKKVIAYTPYLSEEQSRYFADLPNLYYPVVEGKKLYLKHPKDAYNPTFKPKVNWIFEFEKDTVVDYDGINFTCPSNNRLIVSSRPKWLRIDMKPAVYRHIPEIEEGVDGAILAGYQMIKETYDDGATYETYVNKSVALIEKLKHINPDIKIHIEFTSISSKKIRKIILENIIKSHVHCFGLDTVEVANALNVLGHEKLASDILHDPYHSLPHIYEGARILLKELELTAVLIHSFGYYVCATTPECPLSGEQVQKSMFFASTLAAARALHGQVNGLDSVDDGLSVPVSSDGIQQLNQLKDYLGDKGIEFCNGVSVGSECADCTISVIPTKIVPHPVATVGLGDVISTATFMGILGQLKALSSPAADK